MKNYIYSLVFALCFIACSTSNDEAINNDSSTTMENQNFSKVSLNSSNGEEVPIDDNIQYPDLYQTCPSACAGKGEDCSPWNPTVCGSVCQILEVGNVVTYSDVHQDLTLSRDFVDIYPEFYAIRDTLDNYANGTEIVRNYYKYGELYHEGEVEVSFSIHKDIAIEIVRKTSKLIEFVTNDNSRKILYDEEDADTYIEIINDLRGESNNTEFREVLSFFENTIDDHKSESIHEIYEFIKS